MPFSLLHSNFISIYLKDRRTEKRIKLQLALFHSGGYTTCIFIRTDRFNQTAMYQSPIPRYLLLLRTPDFQAQHLASLPNAKKQFLASIQPRPIGVFGIMQVDADEQADRCSFPVST